MSMDVFLLEDEDYPVFADLFEGDLNTLGNTGIAFGAVADGEPAALAVIQIRPVDRTCWLDWLYVRSDKRRQGIATKLLFSLVQKLAKSVHIDTLEASCIDEEQKAFFSAIGFSIREVSYCHIYEAKLSGLKSLSNHKPKHKGKQLASLSTEELEELGNELFSDPHALPFRLDQKTCLPESAYYRTEEGLQALLILEEEKGILSVSYAYAKQGNGAALMELIVEAEESVRSRMKDDTVIRITTVNENSANLVEKLLPDAEKKPVFLAEEDLLFI